VCRECELPWRWLCYNVEANVELSLACLGRGGISGKCRFECGVRAFAAF